jgi:hypothetical protein
MAVATVGDDAIFAGGLGPTSPSSAMDIYNTSTGQWYTDSLTQASQTISVATAGTKAIFAEGYSDNGPSNVVDIYDASTGLSSLTTVLSAGFTDSYVYASTTTDSATVNWGDGTTSTGTVVSADPNFTITASHIYATNASHVVYVTMADSLGTATTIGTTYTGGLELDSQGNLLSFVGSTFTTIDTNVKTYLPDNNGPIPMLFTLHTDGSLWVPGSPSSFDQNVASILVGPDGTLYASSRREQRARRSSEMSSAWLRTGMEISTGWTPTTRSTSLCH